MINSHSSLFSLLFLPSILLALALPHSTGDLIDEPIDPNDGNTVPAYPIQPDSSICHLDLSAELFGGVSDACGSNLDRSRCCPVLAAWLYAAYARSALAIPPATAPSPLSSSSSSSWSSDLPMMPEDNSQKCASSLEDALLKKNIKLAHPNATCDAMLCFCGIRLHQIMDLNCPAAFNLSEFRGKTDMGVEKDSGHDNHTSTGAHDSHSSDDSERSNHFQGNSTKNVTNHEDATPTAMVKDLEKNCKNSSYAGCTKCLGALQKLKPNGTGSSRASKMFNKDCQLMGLTWLLARNKTAYIPTVSAVLRAIMYSPHSHEAKCSPDQENMPLAVDSLQLHSSQSSSAASVSFSFALTFPILSLIMMLFCF